MEIAEDEISQKNDDSAQLQADSFEGAAAVEKLSLVPIFGRLSTGRAGGRQHPFWLREWGYELLVLGVLPTAIPSVMTSSASFLLQWEKNVDVPNSKFFRDLRRELTIVVETLAAYKLAKSLCVRQIGTDATSRKKLELLTSNVMITCPDGSVGPLIMSGAYIARGATSELEANGVLSMFERGREKLGWWIDIVREEYPGVDFGESAIPDPELCTLGRLGGGGAVTSDTCNQARKTCKILAQLIADDVKRTTGPEAWAALSEAEQKKKTRTVVTECWHHLRNIWLNGGFVKQITELLKEQIKIRVIGFGWTQFPLAWSSAADNTIGTVPDLLARFKDILKYEVKYGFPDVPNTPRLTPRCVKQLGTPTEQRIMFENELEISKEENETLVMAARQKRDDAAGGSTAHLQPHVAPKLKVGMKIEVLLGYFEDKKKCMSWFAGVIQRISDGSDAYKKGGRMKGNYAADFCLMRWDVWKTDDGTVAELEDEEFEETWQAIKVTNFNKERSSGWRVDTY